MASVWRERLGRWENCKANLIEKFLPFRTAVVIYSETLHIEINTVSNTDENAYMCRQEQAKDPLYFILVTPKAASKMDRSRFLVENCLNTWGLFLSDIFVILQAGINFSKDITAFTI